MTQLLPNAKIQLPPGTNNNNPTNNNSSGTGTDKSKKEAEEVSDDVGIGVTAVNSTFFMLEKHITWAQELAGIAEGTEDFVDIGKRMYFFPITRTFGIIGVAATIYDMTNGQGPNWETGTNLAMGLICILPGTDLIGFVYFGTDYILQKTTGNGAGYWIGQSVDGVANFLINHPIPVPTVNGTPVPIRHFH